MSKREKLAELLKATSLLSGLESLAQKPQMLVLTYHRIGAPQASPFDREVFSTSADGLDAQIKALKKNCTIIDADGARAILSGRERPKGVAVLLTFDDGYADNLDVALPVLLSHNVTGVFFLVSSFLDDPATVPWWDRIAWLVRRLHGRHLKLTVPQPFEADVTEANADAIISVILGNFRLAGGSTRMIEELTEQAGATPEGVEKPLFFDWSGAEALRDAGMEIGVHTHTHPILSSLDGPQQFDEINICRTRLRQRLGVAADMLCIPVGTPNSFNAETKRAAAAAGCSTAFSFYGGSNPIGAIDAFDVRRVSFHSFDHRARNRLSVAAIARDGRTWF